MVTSHAEVIPLPKRQESQKIKKNKKQKSKILTSSPLKDQFFATEEKKGKLKKNVKKTGEKKVEIYLMETMERREKNGTT